MAGKTTRSFVAFIICVIIFAVTVAFDDAFAGVADVEYSSGLLITDGNAYATIVIPAKPQKGEVYAAEDLQQVFHSMTGVTLPIRKDEQDIRGNRILIGNTCYTDAVVSPEQRKTLGEEGYIVRLKGRDLALVGGGPYGTIYAITELYDRLGARWYMPGELGQCIPTLQTIAFDELDVRQVPAFKMRWVGTDIKWNLRNRTNRIGGIGDVPELEKGKDYYRADPSKLPPSPFVVYPGIFHTQNTWLPDAKYGKTHPEFFALIDGKRSDNAKLRKLCNSNPQVAKEIAHNMAQALRDDPDIDLVSLSPTDFQMWCQCEKCCKLDDDSVDPNLPAVPRTQKYSRRQMALYNRVAEELEKEFPNQQILVGAYNVFAWPPRDPDIQAHKNLAVILCHYEPDACLAHSVSNPDCPPNQKYLQIIRAWQKHTPHIYFYEYYLKALWLDLPWPIVHSIANDVPFFKSNGIEGLYSQYSTKSIWPNFIPMYVAARLLWDPTTDVKALVDELYVKFYGASTGPMRRYHELLEEQMATWDGHTAGNTPRDAHLVFTEDIVAQMKRNLSGAQSLARTDIVKRRLEKIAIMTDWTERLVGILRLSHKIKKMKSDEKRDAQKTLFFKADALRDDLLAKRKYYDGVIWGLYFEDDVLMARTIRKWREPLIQRGLIDPNQYPDKYGDGSRWR